MDDLSAHLSCYGATTIVTPHLDRLSREGTRFLNAFVTAPVCSPCRSAVITRCYQTTIGAHHHRSGRGVAKIRLPEGVVPLPEVQLPGGKLRGATDPAKVSLPPYYPRDPVLLRDWAAYLDSVRLTDAHVGPSTSGGARTTRATYCTMIIQGDWPWHGNRGNTDRRSQWHNYKGKSRYHMLLADGHLEFHLIPDAPQMEAWIFDPKPDPNWRWW